MINVLVYDAACFESSRIVWIFYVADLCINVINICIIEF